MHKRLSRVAAFVALFACLSPALGQPVPAPKNVIVMISDGMGPAAITLTRLVSEKKSLVMDDYLVGTRLTSSEDKMVTDSAAGATAMSAGVRTKNGCVCVTPAGEPVGTVLEAAKFQRKMATGLVVKSRITHATPAGFSAHVLDRDDEARIASQQLALHMDVMFGGGRDYLLPATAAGKRKDTRDLLAEAKGSGYQVITTVEELSAPLKMPVLGLFNGDALHYDIDRIPSQEPSLEEMTRKALALLATHEEGFFLMIEGSEIDHTAHANDAGALVPEVLGYEAAFAAAIEFARRDGRTLVVSTSDHETGGLTINGGDWTTDKVGPLRLKANKASADAMVTLITGGQTLADVLAAKAGIGSITNAETQAYSAATAGNASEVQARRIVALAKIINARAEVKFASTGHSAVDVPVYAFGPGQELFRGARPATYLATAVAELLKLDLAAATKEARDRIKGDVGKRGGTSTD